MNFLLVNQINNNKKRIQTKWKALVYIKNPDQAKVRAVEYSIS